MRVQLPNFFTIHQAKDLVRIGRNNDGGYLVSQSDIKKSDLLIGFGICDDWSFEEDFALLNDVEVVAYDASVNMRFWFKRAIVETIKKPLSFYALRKYLSYVKFFKGKHKHEKKFIGLNSSEAIHCTFVEVLNENSGQNIFFKIDIEGSEYRFLEDIIAFEDRISGMVIELHDVDIHLSKIEKFIKNFSLPLVHIHANNCSPVRAEDNLPLVLELTFSKYCDVTKEFQSPHDLDMPNNKKYPEYEITIKD